MKHLMKFTDIEGIKRTINPNYVIAINHKVDIVTGYGHEEDDIRPKPIHESGSVVSWAAYEGESGDGDSIATTAAYAVVMDSQIPHEALVSLWESALGIQEEETSKYQHRGQLGQ